MGNAPNDQILNRLKAIPGGRVLDVGTGSGVFIDVLMKTLMNYHSFTGIDINKERLESARKEFEKAPVEFSEMNAESIEFEDASFDTVCIRDSLHSLDNPEKVLTEMARVLKPGGFLIAEEPYYGGEQTPMLETTLEYYRWRASVNSILGRTNRELLTQSKMIAAVKSLGLGKIETFESRYSIRYLLRDEREKQLNQITEESAGFILENIDQHLDMLTTHLQSNPHLDLRDWQDKGEKLKEKVKAHGFSNALYLILIGQK